MQPSDLDLREILDLPSRGGVLRFAGQRVLLMDAGAMGLLRRELVDRLGETVARAVLTRFGFAHGWRTAEAMRDALPWDTERDWRIAGGRFHMLQGQVAYEPTQPNGESVEGGPFAALFERLLARVQHGGVEIVTLETVARSLEARALPLRELAHVELAGRAGLVSSSAPAGIPA